MNQYIQREDGTYYVPPGNEALHLWFELSYARYLTIPRLVMYSMPDEWQLQMAKLLEELDETLDWRPTEGRYWVKLKDAKGRYVSPPHEDYRHGEKLPHRSKGERK